MLFRLIHKEDAKYAAYSGENDHLFRMMQYAPTP
jgi:hypothetical protein